MGEQKQPQRKGKPTTIRLTQYGEFLLDELVRKYGVSKSAIVEIAIREKAERDKVGKTN